MTSTQQMLRHIWPRPPISVQEFPTYFHSMSCFTHPKIPIRGHFWRISHSIFFLVRSLNICSNFEGIIFGKFRNLMKIMGKSCRYRRPRPYGQFSSQLSAVRAVSAPKIDFSPFGAGNFHIFLILFSRPNSSELKMLRNNIVFGFSITNP